MIRDPRDRFASSYARWKVRRGGVGAGTAEWLSSARIALEGERRFPDAYRIVRYETLVSEPEATMRELCAFIGEEYLPQILELGGAPQMAEGNSSYGAREVKGISASSVGKFRDVLTPRQVAFMQRACAGEMATFGYAPEPVELSAVGRLAHAVVDVPVETAHLWLWRRRESHRDRAGRPLRPSRLVGEEAVA